MQENDNDHQSRFLEAPLVRKRTESLKIGKIRPQWLGFLRPGHKMIYASSTPRWEINELGHLIETPGYRKPKDIKQLCSWIIEPLDMNL